MRRKKFLETISKHFWKGIIVDNEIDFDEGISIFGNNSRIKIYFKGNCVKCNKEFRARYDKLRDRKVFPMAIYNILDFFDVVFLDLLFVCE
jgi:hypothetical protein